MKWLYDARWYTNMGVDSWAISSTRNVVPFNSSSTSRIAGGPQRQSTANKNPSLLNHC